MKYGLSGTKETVSNGPFFTHRHFAQKQNISATKPCSEKVEKEVKREETMHFILWEVNMATA